MHQQQEQVLHRLPSHGTCLARWQNHPTTYFEAKAHEETDRARPGGNLLMVCERLARHGVPRTHNARGHRTVYDDSGK
eukprot:3682877-Rhodomonas_salina.1